MLFSNNKKGPQGEPVAQVYGRKNTQPLVKTEHFQNDTCSKMSLFAGVFLKPRKKVSEIRQVILALALVLALGLSLTPGPVISQASTVLASWYGPGFHGRRTANGERFNQHAMTAAHRSLPFGTLVRVTHKGRSVTVRINDRGPFIRGRSLDLSKGAARAIGCHGVCRVNMTVIGRHGKKRRGA